MRRRRTFPFSGTFPAQLCASHSQALLASPTDLLAMLGIDVYVSAVKTDESQSAWCRAAVIIPRGGQKEPLQLHVPALDFGLMLCPSCGGSTALRWSGRLIVLCGVTPQFIIDTLLLKLGKQFT